VLQYGSNSSNAGHTVVAIKKHELYQGSFLATTLLLTNGLSLQTWTIQPAVNFDAVATNGYAWFVTKGPPDWSQRRRAALRAATDPRQ